MTDADRAALAAWLASDPEHRWVLSRYRQLSAQLEAELEVLVDSATKARARARRRWQHRGLALAAAAAIAMATIVWTRGANEFTTRAAERHMAALSDGSRVELNALTELRVAFRRDERRVRLVRGEALFSVAAEKARPFIVETPSGTVRVTGTVFNVRSTPRETVEVTVLEGRVRVQPSGAGDGQTALQAGQQGILAGARLDVRDVGANSAQNAIAWREGQVVFEDTPLRDALERFAAYHGRTIDVDSRIANRRLGGRYGLDDLEGLLDEIERVLPVRVLRQGGGLVRLVPAEGK